MQAKDVMTAPAIAVEPQTPLQEVIDLLLTHRIGGVFVMDQGQVVGTVGAGDLVHRCELGTDCATSGRGWWHRLLQSEPASVAYIKSHGRHAADVMNRHVVALSEDTPIAELATAFEAREVRRIAVLQGGELAGVVTRADLVRALAARAVANAPQPPCENDEAIRMRLLAELRTQPWWGGNWSSVFVHDGVVRFVGAFQTAADRDAARCAAENIPGVRAVEDRRVHLGEWQPMF